MQKNGVDFNLEINEITSSIKNNRRKYDNHIVLFIRHELLNSLKQIHNKVRVEHFRPTKIFPIFTYYEINN